MRKLQFKFLLAGCLGASMFVQQVTAQKTDSKKPQAITKEDDSQKKTKLITILKELNKQKGIFFLMADPKLGNTQVYYVNYANENVDRMLSKLLKNTGITYKQVDKKTFVILPEGDRGEVANIDPLDVIQNTPPSAGDGYVGIYNTDYKYEITKGRVVGSDGKPVSGASVIVKGTKKGTSTNDNGDFNIEASNGDVLVVSSIGFDTREITVSSNNFTVTLAQSNKESVETIVVTALGIRRTEKSLTYAQQQVGGEELNKVKTDNVINALSGKVAGLTITPSASGVGGSSKVILRGVRSATGNSQPLYVIDGIPILNSSNANGQPANTYGGSTDGGDGISNLNPDDIASMSVLEGASAAALYGHEGQNGVILITTKKGRAGKPEINFTSTATLQNAAFEPKFQNKYGQAQTGTKESWATTPSLTGTQDNLSKFFQTGLNLTNAINFSTGSENSQTYFSYANTHATGIEPSNQLDRHNFNLRETARFFNNKLTLDGNISYISQNINNSPAIGLYFNPLTGLYLFPRGLNIDTYKNNYLNPNAVGYARQNWSADEDVQQNPWWIINRDPNKLTRNRFIVNGSVRYDATSWLNFQARGSLDRVSDDYEMDVYSGTQSTLDSHGNGSLQLSTQTVQQKYGDFLATVTVPTKGAFKVNAVVGASIKDINTTGLRVGRGQGPNFPGGPAINDLGLSIPDLFTPGNIVTAVGTSNTTAVAPDREQTQSIFGNLNASYNDWVYLTLTDRYDWSSLLAFTPKVDFSYPSVGLSFIVSQMAKMPVAIDYLKVRGSYAEVGNPPSIPYITNILNLESGAGLLVFNNAHAIGTLKPEDTKSFELGLDLKIFKKLNASFTFYNTKTVNQLFQVSPPTPSLFSTAFVNAGEIKNTGEELTLTYDVVKHKNFSWSTSINGSHNENTVVDVDTPDAINSYVLTGAANNAYESILSKGGSAGDIYGYTFLRDAQGRIQISSSGVPLYSSSFNYVGNPNPKFQLGWANSFGYKNFNLSFLVDGKFGGQVLSLTQAMMDFYGVSKVTGDARDAGSVAVNGVDPNGKPVTTVTPINWYQSIGGRAGVSEAYMYSATVVRLREASFGYTFPIKSSTFKSIRLAVTGRNLIYFYKKAPYDPEVTMSTGAGLSGVDVFNQPATRNIGLNLNVNF